MRDRSSSLIRCDAQWMPDEASVQCSHPHCAIKFNVLIPSKRKHHCRFCGKIFCDRHAPICRLENGTPLLPVNYTEARRCMACRIPVALFASRHIPSAKLDATPADIIFSFLDARSLNSLLQTSTATLHHFHVPGVPYQPSLQTRFPSLFDGAKVGRGGSGTVFKVEDRLNANQKVAVKVVHKGSVFGYGAWRKLLTEIRIMRGNAHANVAKLNEVFQTRHELVMVVELGGGGSLKKACEVIRAKKYDMEIFTACVVAQVAAGLDYLYGTRRVVHRDIKHDNIILSRDFSRVMLIDFGLAEELRGDSQRFVPCGTMGFASPENIRAVVERRSQFVATPAMMHASDMFSLGVVAFSMLSSQKPFRGVRFVDLHNEVKRGLRCTGARWTDVSDHAKHLVEWLLHSNFEQRALPTHVYSHPFICRKTPLFCCIEVPMKEELEADDQHEEQAWIFVGGEEEWGVIDTPKDETSRRNSDSGPSPTAAE